MKPFKEVIDGIRKAVMASEVREDIAQGLEYAEQFANTAGENIKKAIDPTLSVSGKAADAAKVGEAVNAEVERAKGVESQIKEDLDDGLGKQLKAKANKEADKIVLSFTNIYFLNFDNVIKAANDVIVKAKTNDKNANSALKIYITEKIDTNKCNILKIIERNFVNTSLEEIVDISNYNNVVIGLSGALLYTNNTDKFGAAAESGTVGETLNVYLNSDFLIDYNASVFVRFDLEQITKTTKDDKAVVTVSPYGDKRFRTITEAVNYAAPLTSEEKPITILIYPGTYNEIINIQNKNLSLIGINKKDCIIQSNSGEYADAPVLASGNFYIANLTIKATHDGTPDFVENRTDDYKIGGYGLHIDNAYYSDESDKIGVVENCIIYSAQNQAIGMGMAKNCKYIIRNCELINDTPDRMYELYTRPLKTGALGCHRGYFDGSNYYQILEVSNCILKVNKGVSIQLGPFTKEGTGMEEHFYNNMLWSGTLGKADSAIGTYSESPYTSFELSGDCYGNNVSALNK
nr:MAG TPA: pectinesterase [Caudoviricetes sp.]